MVRICPKRDAQCPHGDNCPLAIDRYSCAPELSTPMTNPMELVKALRALIEPRVSRSLTDLADRAADLIEAQAAQLAERDRENGVLRESEAWAVKRLNDAEALLQQARKLLLEAERRLRVTDDGNDWDFAEHQIVPFLNIQPGDSHE